MIIDGFPGNCGVYVFTDFGEEEYNTLTKADRCWYRRRLRRELRASLDNFDGHTGMYVLTLADAHPNHDDFKQNMLYGPTVRSLGFRPVKTWTNPSTRSVCTMYVKTVNQRRRG